MRYTLSNRQEKALHINAQALTICLPLTIDQLKTLPQDARGDDPTAINLARSLIAAEGVKVEWAGVSKVQVKVWTGPRQQPHGLADVLGEIVGGDEDAGPLRPGFILSMVTVLIACISSVAKTAQKGAAPPAWPADFIADGEARPYLKTARASQAAGVELLREGQRQGDYGPDGPARGPGGELRGGPR